VSEAPFSVQDGVPRLRGTRCRKCGHRWFPASSFGCERCGGFGEDLELFAMGGGGRLLSSARIADGEDGFMLGSIELDDGPVVRGILEDATAAAAGDRLEAFVTTDAGKDVVRFRKIDGANA
jgi:uncharacterized OB-fold protein